METRQKVKKMLSWSSDSDEEDEEELKAIEKEVIAQRRNLKVVNEPQLLSRKVDSHTINSKFLRVSKNCTFYEPKNSI